MGGKDIATFPFIPIQPQKGVHSYLLAPCWNERGLIFFPKYPGEVEAGDSDREQLNGLKGRTALRALQRRGKNKMKAEEFRGLIGRCLPRGE
jgi:hypothetical protein